MGFRIFLVCIYIIFNFSASASAEDSLRAAFIRDHQLWVKVGEKEEQLTKDRYVYYPKWSHDGRFIAFLDGDEHAENTNLFIFDSKEHQIYKPYPITRTLNFQWSPTSNQLAYNSDGVLNVTKTRNGRPEGFSNVSLGVSDFAWFPNGRDFIVSSQSKLLPTGWGSIHLFKIPVDANLNTKKIKPFYTIQTDTPDLFAIDAEYFKWSTDGKWISFLATPTASWSNDSNTLCVLSSVGDNFQVVGKMLWYEDWIKWAPLKNQLAYITGEGRFLVENKKTTVTDIPTFNERKVYTPYGYVDLDLDWLNSEKVIVARSKENKEWQEGPVPTMYTSLFKINIISGKQQQVTFPKKDEFDIKPQVVRSYLTWIRKNEKENKRDVLIKEGIEGQEISWIKNVDSAPVFFNIKQ